MTKKINKCVLLIAAQMVLAFAIVFPSQLSARDITYNDIVYTVIDEDAKTVETKAGTDSKPGNTGVAGTLVLPETIKDDSGIAYTLVRIGTYSFLWNNHLESVVIPNTVTFIGNYAFDGCYVLKSVNIPNSVTSIGNYAFSSCSKLSSIVIPSSVTSIGRGAFSHCSGLTSITIPNSVTSIGKSAFNDCTSLTSVEIPNSVTSIGESAFNYCTSLTSVNIPNSVTSIGKSAFNYCTSLTSVNIPNSVTSIGEEAFSYCTSLTSVNIPNSVTSIGANAFYNCTSLTSIEIPNSVTSIGEATFTFCESLTSIEIPNSVTSIGADAFFSCTSLTSVNIPNSVTSIGTYTFAFCESLTSVNIPNSVTSIGIKAFCECSGLKSISIAAMTPPAAEDNSFENYDCPIYVMADALETYKATSPWASFTNYNTLIEPTALEIAGPSEYGVKPGDTFKLTATISPANVSLPQIFWRSTNPTLASVDNDGNVTVNEVVANTYSADGNVCEIIAETMYDNAPVAKVALKIAATGIDNIPANGEQTAPVRSNDIYNAQGVCLKRNASQADIDALAPGLYIVGGKKVLVK